MIGPFLVKLLRKPFADELAEGRAAKAEVKRLHVLADVALGHLRNANLNGQPKAAAEAEFICAHMAVEQMLPTKPIRQEYRGTSRAEGRQKVKLDRYASLSELRNWPAADKYKRDREAIKQDATNGPRGAY